MTAHPAIAQIARRRLFVTFGACAATYVAALLLSGFWVYLTAAPGAMTTQRSWWYETPSHMPVRATMHQCVVGDAYSFHYSLEWRSGVLLQNTCYWSVRRIGATWVMLCVCWLLTSVVCAGGGLRRALVLGGVSLTTLVPFMACLPVYLAAKLCFVFFLCGEDVFPTLCYAHALCAAGPLVFLCRAVCVLGHGWRRPIGVVAVGALPAYYLSTRCLGMAAVLAMDWI
jgi:hypothetical protein